MKFRLTFAGAVAALPFFVFAQNYTFSRNLQVGVSGDDVLALQKALNLDSATKVADTGPGSPGNETRYFGPATAQAVVRFQEKYSADVLQPVGLTVGTGYFGEKTREKINSLLANSSTTKNTAQGDTISTVGTAPAPAAPQGLEGVVIKTPSQYSGKPGTSITIGGWGFTPTNNTIYFGSSYKVENVASSDGYTLTFSVPSIPAGAYVISLKNSNGESQTKTFFSVTSATATTPVIESIMPESAKRGETVTIKGTGFSATGNMLRTSLGVFENIPSVDGTTILFTIPTNTFTTPPTGFSIPTSTPPVTAAIFTMPVWVYVANANGLSNGQSFNASF